MSRLSVQVGMGPPEGSTGWQPLRIGGGGWITGLSFSDDGATRVARADAFGAYLWDATASEWKQLITDTRMPAGEVVPDQQDGCWEIKPAPGDSTRIYMCYRGELYKSTNSGASFTKCSAFGNKTQNANDAYSSYGQKMAVDPANADVVYIGSQSEGLWQTLDGGTTFTHITDVPDATSEGITGIAFDPTSGTTGGKTNTIYAVSSGNGVYRSTNAGTSWAVVGSGGPTQARHAAVSPTDGTYWVIAYVASYATANVWRLVGTTWTQLTTGSNPGQWHSVSCDPFLDNRVILGNGGSSMVQTLDNGATWPTNINDSGAARSSPLIPWLAWTNESYMSNGDMVWDPVVQNKLWFGEGIGIWHTSISPTSTPSTTTWVSSCVGVEELCALTIVRPPGTEHITITGLDRPTFYRTRAQRDTFPSVHGPDAALAILHGWAVDWASSDPDFLVAVMNAPPYGTVERSGYSTDGGETWTDFATIPAWSASAGGSIAASTPDNIVWNSANTNGTAAGKAPYYTLDGGDTWTKCVFPGVSDNWDEGTGWGGFHRALYYVRHIICADRVRANKFYCFHWNQGLYVTTDGGVNWTQAYSGVIGGEGNNAQYHAKLRAVPGKEGHLFFTCGRLDGVEPGGGFYHSTNGGITWSAISNVLEVWAFGFGKQTGSYPAIYIYGWVSGEVGLWRSDDEGATWTKNVSFPLGLLDAVQWVEGDMDNAGEVYVAIGASGWAYYTP